jgi:hypothetical protein
VHGSAAVDRRRSNIEHMTESVPVEPPTVTVRLPGGRRVTGALLRWRQNPVDHTWWAEVTTYVPAAAVAPVDGQDYAPVPREYAKSPEPGYVITADTRMSPPTAELHLATCWTIAEPAAWRRITPSVQCR